ncbi:hypothetical protein P8629_11105 [Hydrogenovibrio sp. 3SP14C1]|uniref:hypothetical protein n=1 Tax=Hydrogenovibrio sp. 3SP14C1 TaxID=3038774 RepID=UPI0024174839|nr:hypothetical protein [Hydrogenovibrio sp. 3SP14C1]MDG4813556.1 hypothetical protein [Hydrogenovibrio sp. 3SP14C1]
MTNEILDPIHFVLKVKGKHNLIFKTKHNDPEYLKKVGEELVAQEDGHFTEYEVHRSDHANKEMTQAEHLLHPHFD